MQESFEYRSGLSAVVPWSAYDEKIGETDSLLEILLDGQIVTSSLNLIGSKYYVTKKWCSILDYEGIEKGILCEFDYQPLDFEPLMKRRQNMMYW